MIIARIYINGTEADVSTDEAMRLGVNFGVADIRDITTRSGSVTYTISLPMTATNRNIFGFADLPDASGYDQTQRYAARIDVGDITVLRGHCKIVGSKTTMNGDSSYEVILLGDNGDWKAAISEKNLSELDLSVMDHVMTAQNIWATWSGPSYYLYPMVNYGRFTGGLNPAVEDFRPAFSVGHTLKAIFNEQGYKVQSSFIDGAFFDNLYWLPGTNAGISETFRSARLFRVGLTGNQTSGTLTYGTDETATIELNDLTSSGYFNSTNSNWIAGSYWYLSDAAAKHKFYASIQLEYTSTYKDNANVYVDLMLTRGGTDSVIASKVWYDLDKAGEQGTLESGWVKLVSGDKVWLRYTLVNANGDPGKDIAVQFVDDGTYLYNEISKDAVEGCTITASEWMPDKTCIEFLQGVKDAFNLYFYTDTGARTVYIEPADDFYLGNDQAVDWSEKLDVGSMQAVNFIDGYARKSVFRYKEDSDDYLAARVEDRTGKALLSGDYTHSNKFASGEDEYENGFFAPTLMRREKYIAGMHTVMLPTIWRETDDDQPEQRFEHEPRLLYYDSYAPLGYSWYPMGYTLQYYPKVYSYDESTANDSSLDYADGSAYKGLITRYFANTLKNLDNGKLFVGQFNLSSLDISNLNPRKPVYVNGTHYRLNGIKDWAPNGTCEVELLRTGNKSAYTPVTEISGESPSTWADSSAPPLVPVFIMDERVRPANAVDVVIMDDNGNLVKVYVEG